MNILGMGWEEMMIILVGALLIFGPDRLPEVAGQIGKFLRDARKMTSELTGELEKTAGVGDIKRAVQNELAGVKSQVDSATKGVQATASSAVSSVNKAATGSTTAAKAGTTATAAKPATSSTTAKSATADKPAPKPVASKKDPWADVSFFDDPSSVKEVAVTAPVIPASSAVVTASAAPLASLDALGRARQRRIAAGYNQRHAS